MSNELSIPVTMKAMAPGHPLAGAGELCSGEDLIFSCVRSAVLTHSPLPGLMACQRAKRLADAIMLHVVLLCTLLGYRMVRPDETGWPEERAFFRACRFLSLDICGIFPVFTGTGAGSFRTLLHQ